MKGYCKWCGCEIDEVEHLQFDGAHETCCKVIIQVKYPNLKIINKKKQEELYYECNTAKWNFYLNRFYPSAELILKRCQLNNDLTLAID